MCESRFYRKALFGLTMICCITGVPSAEAEEPAPEAETITLNCGDTYGPAACGRRNTGTDGFDWKTSTTFNCTDSEANKNLACVKACLDSRESFDSEGDLAKQLRNYLDGRGPKFSCSKEVVTENARYTCTNPQKCQLTVEYEGLKRVAQFLVRHDSVTPGACDGGTLECSCEGTILEITAEYLTVKASCSECPLYGVYDQDASAASAQDPVVNYQSDAEVEAVLEALVHMADETVVE